MIEEIGEPIDVVAAFTNGKLMPILFSWHSRRYYNLKVASVWNEREGESRLIHIIVTADTPNQYEICFNTGNFKWNLVKVDHE